MKVAVVGAGTAGIYCVIELLEGLPKFAKIDLIHSKVIDPLGVGESSLVSFPHALSCGIDYIHHFDSQELGSTIKYGVQFKNWNGVGLIPFASGSYGIQFDTTQLPQFAIPRLHQMYSNFSERVRTVKEIKSLGKKVSIDGEIYDFVVDCRGYPLQSTTKSYISPSIETFLPSDLISFTVLTLSEKLEYIWCSLGMAN